MHGGGLVPELGHGEPGWGQGAAVEPEAGTELVARSPKAERASCQGEGGRARGDTFALWTSFCFRISKTPVLWAPGRFGPVSAFACPGHAGQPL